MRTPPSPAWLRALPGLLPFPNLAEGHGAWRCWQASKPASQQAYASQHRQDRTGASMVTRTPGRKDASIRTAFVVLYMRYAIFNISFKFILFIIIMLQSYWTILRSFPCSLCTLLYRNRERTCLFRSVPLYRVLPVQIQRVQTEERTHPIRSCRAYAKNELLSSNIDICENLSVQIERLGVFYKFIPPVRIEVFLQV